LTQDLSADTAGCTAMKYGNASRQTRPRTT
jgi:hypothetical protein